MRVHLAVLAVSWTVLAGAACAKPVVISGAVVDAEGRPIARAIVSSNGQEVSADTSGRFSIPVAETDSWRLDFRAPGFFPSIQTFSRADLRVPGSSRIAVPPVVLVERVANRHLYVFAGDTMMGRRYVDPRDGEPALIRDGSVAKDMQSILQFVKPYLELGDLASVNLETQLSAAEPPQRAPKFVTFFTAPEIAAALKQAGVDYAALGNNHTFDYLDAGLNRTVEAMQRAGLAYSGAGRTEAEARKPHTTAVGEQRVDLLSYVGWPGNFEPNQVAERDKGGAAYGTASAIAADLDAVPGDALAVVQYHSGLEYVSNPPLAEETQLKLAIDNGADLAIGHHAHVFQGLEVYAGKLIAYSLGNFVFDQYLPSTHSGILLFAWYDGDDFHHGEIVPLHVNGYVPTPATGSFRFDILQRIVRLSDPGSICWTPSGAHAAFRECAEDEPAAVAQVLAPPGAAEPGTVLRLSSVGADPLRPIRAVRTARPYRLGLDLLRRGDFEYSGLFGTRDRTWIDHDKVSIVAAESKLMRVRLPAGETASTGMKVFTRVFERSNPATVSGRVRTSGCATLRFALQRRPDRMSLDDALADGPVTDIGRFAAAGPGWSEFALDLQLPRTSTRSVRLLVDVGNCDPSGAEIQVDIDDLALIEWRTPWQRSEEPLANGDRLQATHLQYLADE